jgi:hypothetical protein
MAKGQALKGPDNREGNERTADADCRGGQFDVAWDRGPLAVKMRSIHSSSARTEEFFLAKATELENALAERTFRACSRGRGTTCPSEG